MKRTSLLQCDTQTLEHGGFAFKRKRLGAQAGGKGLGTSWFELQPGKKAFPMHFHLANEEAIFILEGEGVLRVGPLPGATDQKIEEHPLRAGDYVAFPAGPPGRQVVNNSAGVLRFLAISTMIEPEVAVYPESKKVGFLARGMGLAAVHKEEGAVDYYEGEE
jgi:uncharacterized cupin superfamily protein